MPKIYAVTWANTPDQRSSTKIGRINAQLRSSQLGVRIAQFTSEMLGTHAVVNETLDSVLDASRWFNRVISARQYTFAGDTSEIQRNIIGERVLGLPKG